MESLEIYPHDIDIILLTHAHPDHIGGLLTDPERIVFPNATLWVHKNEYRFWMSESERVKASERAQRNFKLARRVFSAYCDQIKFFNNSEILAGIQAVPLPGHTVGHTGYMIKFDEESLLVWGDIVHFPEIQVAYPDVTIEFDYDKAAAAITRKKLLKIVSSENILIAGMHLSESCFAYINEVNGQFIVDYQIKDREHQL